MYFPCNTVFLCCNNISLADDGFLTIFMSIFFLSIFSIKLIPESLRRCPHGIIGGQTKNKCSICNEEKIKEELREKWRDDDSHKLWEIFEEENERRLRDEESKKKKAELEKRNSRLWEEEQLMLLNRELDNRKRIEERNRTIWIEEVAPSGSSDNDYKSEINDYFERNERITEKNKFDNDSLYDPDSRKAVWDEIDKSIREKEIESSFIKASLSNSQYRELAEKTYQEELEKINYLKKKKISHLKALSLKSFEKYIIEMFKKLGYSFRVSRRENDSGKIIALYKKTNKYLLLCKKYPDSFQINISEIQKLALAIANQRAAGGFLVTTCNFSKPAFQAAIESGIEPVDVYALTKMLNEAYPVSFNDERIRTVCLVCGDIVYFNLFDGNDYRLCRNGHEVSNMMQNRILRS